MAYSFPDAEMLSVRDVRDCWVFCLRAPRVLSAARGEGEFPDSPGMERYCPKAVRCVNGRAALRGEPPRATSCSRTRGDGGCGRRVRRQKWRAWPCTVRRCL